MFKSLENKRNRITLMLCVGVIQVSLYYLLGATLRGDHAFAFAQPDTALYFQAARRICEGAPFSYSAGEAVTTGTTSVLYPFVLAVPYALGAVGNAICRVGFLINAAFYLVFLLGWGLVIERKMANVSAKVLALGLLALFGQSAFSALSQSDIGLWMAVSSWLVYAIVLEKEYLALGLLMVSPFVRPEGMICVVMLAVFKRKRFLVPLLSVVAVFALNYWLTGDCRFSSVQGKGHFATEPFFLAITASAKDALVMFRQIFLGIGGAGAHFWREYFFLPVIGAVCGWYFLFTCDFRRLKSGEIALIFAAIFGFATVATSGMQGTNFDRYLAWMLPAFLICVACGADAVSEKLSNRHNSPSIVHYLFLFFAFCSSIASAAYFRMACEDTEVKQAFYERCERTMTLKSAIGSFGNSGAVYSFSPRRFVHLYGIYSPGFKTKSQASVFEELKYRADDRFWYWLYDASIDGEVVGDCDKSIFGLTELAGPGGIELRKANWKPFDAAKTPVDNGNLEGRSLKCRVDVGYDKDENAADYEVFGDYGMRAPEPFVRLDDLEGRGRIAEVGRVVLGGDEMTITNLEPNREITVVMRTAAEQKAVVQYAANRVLETYSFESPQELHIEIGEDEVGHVTYNLPKNGFSDVEFKIPAKYVKGDSIRLGLHGDHISCCYWAFQ